MNGLTKAEKSGLTFSALIILYLFISFIGQAVLLLFTESGSVLFLAVSSVFSEIALFTVSLVHRKKTKKTIFDLENVKKFNPLYIILSVLIAAGMLFGLGFLNQTFANVLIGWGLKVNSSSVPLNNVYQFLLFTALLAVVPAVSEELFFRGVFINGLSGVKTVFACLFCGLFFALYHCSATQFIYQFFYGSILALLTVKSGSALPSMIAHFINNFCVLSFEYFKLNIDFYNPLIIILGIVMLAVSVCVLLFFPKIKKTEKVKGEVKKLFFPFGFIGVVLCLVMIIGNLFI